ncbi:hypothetical protein CAI21_09750 [Alkalilimnicola ehrlichii]|uniref:Glycosyl transferase, group 1 n=1 Tax=Alkalilimnicola ehrlichii TaxID=351052 RepID=A0A3E0WVL3_9GAMM|nr:glycosyltransferase family 4 protein [Alkalilimnicola ehrlichii]RFA29344.1 hypothetical protein CAI21_09750 [Alkalilimnicola ehrlichii]RFA36858.1 hypothetical protein CAL65_10085 [Alkalilimnicola ehrlichii]
MRILLITWACDLEDVSEPLISARWVQELSRRHEVTVFAVSRPDRFGCVAEQFPQLEVIEWRDIGVPASLERFRAIVKPGYFPYYFKARRFLKRLLRERAFDVIHHLSPFAWRYPSPAAGLGVPLVRGPIGGGLSTPAGLEAAAKGKAAPFMALRRTDALRRRIDPLLRASYRQTDHLLLAAPYVGNVVEGLEVKATSVDLELGLTDEMLDRPQATCAGKPDGSIDLLFVGRVVRTKGVQFAIRAVAECRNRDKVRLTVVGAGDDLAACRELATELALDDRVAFKGWLPHAEVEGYFLRADAFLFPSFREPTGGALFEAMLYGLPLIACDYGGPEYLVDESCGIRVAPSSEQSYIQGLADAIDRLVEQPELRAAMGAASHQRAREHFTWRAKHQRLDSIYCELVRQSA